MSVSENPFLWFLFCHSIHLVSNIIQDHCLPLTQLTLVILVTGNDRLLSPRLKIHPLNFSLWFISKSKNFNWYFLLSPPLQMMLDHNAWQSKCHTLPPGGQSCSDRTWSQRSKGKNEENLTLKSCTPSRSWCCPTRFGHRNPWGKYDLRARRRTQEAPVCPTLLVPKSRCVHQFMHHNP